MFTGIIESLGKVKSVDNDRSNVHFSIESPISKELKIDQSLSHNGACLTVVEVGTDWHRVTAVEETLRRTNLGNWKPGTLVNLERCLPIGGRLDGHMVQGHVDDVVECVEVLEIGGSWKFSFRFRTEQGGLLVDKGSVCLNGVSLTVVAPQQDLFSVAIIPYTWEHTNFKNLAPRDKVNVEFDILGKYIARQMEIYGTAKSI
ncbi:MAG: riboflavin synthase [Lewinellaceae bacterium]|nr:riboflavin synthase [Lewinellaceae bacterium]